MSNYDIRQLRYSCFSEPSLVSHSHPRSLSLKHVWAIHRGLKVLLNVRNNEAMTEFA